MSLFRLKSARSLTHKAFDDARFVLISVSARTGQLYRSAVARFTLVRRQRNKNLVTAYSA